MSVVMFQAEYIDMNTKKIFACLVLLMWVTWFVFLATKNIYICLTRFYNKFEMVMIQPVFEDI